MSRPHQLNTINNRAERRRHLSRYLRINLDDCYEDDFPLPMMHQSDILVEPPTTLRVSGRTSYTDILQWSIGYLRNCYTTHGLFTDTNLDIVSSAVINTPLFADGPRVRFFAFDALYQTMPFDIERVLIGDEPHITCINGEIKALSIMLSRLFQSDERNLNFNLLGVTLANLISSTYTLITCAQ